MRLPWVKGDLDLNFERFCKALLKGGYNFHSFCVFGIGTLIIISLRLMNKLRWKWNG